MLMMTTIMMLMMTIMTMIAALKKSPFHESESKKTPMSIILMNSFPRIIMMKTIKMTITTCTLSRNDDFVQCTKSSFLESESKEAS